MSANFSEMMRGGAGGEEGETEREPRWPAIVAIAACAMLYAALPPSLSIGPRWLPLLLISLLLVPTVIAHQMGNNHVNHFLGQAASGLMTVFLVYSVERLVAALPKHLETPGALLRSAAALWVANVLVFALWYWRLDAGGPNQRDARREYCRGFHRGGSFVFPQMALDDDARRASGDEHWTPQFMDYLFLAFNTSTALSPTDTSVLSRWAKVLMMLQSAISLTVIALLAARAVNIL